MESAPTPPISDLSLNKEISKKYCQIQTITKLWKKMKKWLTRVAFIRS